MSEKVNIREVLEGLETETRKAGQDEICVYMTSKFEPELYVGVRGVDTRVLTPDASTTLLERLNAELRVPRKGDRVLLEHGEWVVSAYDHTVPAICEKPLEPEFRKLEPGEPVMPGDRLLNDRFGDVGEANQHYRASIPRCQGENTCTYTRKPWTPEEYLKRQAEWVEFHNLKPGDTVKVCCKAKDGQDGWNEFWCEEMSDVVGKELRVSGCRRNGLELQDGFLYPFYVLQVVKKPVPVKPEPRYREFRTPQEVLAWVQAHGQIVVNENGTWGTITGSSISGDNQLYIPGCFTYGYYKHGKSLKDGTPFGVLE